MLRIILILIISVSAHAKRAKSPMGTPAKLYSLQIYPGEIKSLKFKTTKNFPCEDRLTIKKFESTKKLTSVDTNKLGPVNILNIYVRMNKQKNNKLLIACLKKGKGKILKADFNTPKLKNMLHIYVTVNEGINLNL